MVRQLKRTTSKSMLDILKGLSRHERKRLTEELIRVQNPGISNKALKQMVRAGIVPKRYGSQEISRGMRMQLLDAVGATISFSGSAAGGLVGRTLPGNPQGPLLVGVVRTFRTF